MVRFGARLRKSIVAHGISDAEFCRKAGISMSLLSNYIDGTCKPGVDMLATMLDALPNENARWLITGR